MSILRADDDTLTLGWLADLEAKAQAPISSYGMYGASFIGGYGGINSEVAEVPLYLNVIVSTLIGWLGRNFATADMQVIRQTATGDGPAIDGHPFIALMDRPNPLDDFHAFCEAFILSDLIDGNTFFTKVRTRGNGIHSLWWVPPWDVEIIPNPDREMNAEKPILGYDINVGSGKKRYEPEDIIHIKEGRDPYNPFRGLAKFKAGARSASTVDQAEFYSQTLMRNCGALSGVLSPAHPDMVIDPKNVPALRAQWHENQTGKNNGKPLVSTQSFRFDKTGLSPEQMALNEIWKHPIAFLCSLAGVPGMACGLPDPDKTYANLEQAIKSAWENGLIPRQARFAEAMDKQCPELIHPTRERLKWDYKHVKALQENWVAKTDALVKAAGGKAILTVNEARAAINLEPIDGQDELPAPAPPPVPFGSPALPGVPPKPPLGLPAPKPQPGEPAVVEKPKADDDNLETKEDMSPDDAETPPGDEPDPHEDNTFGLPDGRPLRRVLKRFAALQAAQVLGTLPEIGVPIPAVFAPLTDYNDPMASAMTPTISSYWDWGGKTTLAKLGLDPDVWQVVDPNLYRKIAESTLAFCDATNQTTTLQLNDALAKLRKELQEGLVVQGESYRELTKRVQSVFTDLKGNRAENIARTETSRAIHQASIQSAIDSEVCEFKAWRASANSCPLCLAVAESSNDGIPLDAPFATQGNNPTYSIVYNPPLHPRCRCTTRLVLNQEYRDIIAAATGKTAPETVTPLDPKQKPPRKPPRKPKPPVVVISLPEAPKLPRPSQARLELPKGESAKEIEKAAAKIFGKPTGVRDIASMVGAPDDTTVRIFTYPDGSLWVNAESSVVEMRRFLKADTDGKPYIKNEFFKIKSKTDQNQGMGLKIFSDQVENAAAMGIKEIRTEAARSGGFNGYYTWARFGYDGAIPGGLAPLPDALKSAKRLSDVMATQEGRDWWKTNGVTVNLEFDLTEGSYSRRTLDAYRAERAKKETDGN